jgi:DNA-binding MurR/RpiR family transcriptional regulator
MSALELGKRVGVSDATIIRFAKAIGFDGYIDLKNAIKNSMKDIGAPDKRLLKNWNRFKDSNDLVMQIAHTDVSNLENFLLNIDHDKIDKIVQSIFRAKTIYFLGIGSSRVIAQFMAWHMRRMGFSVVNINDGGLVLFETLSATTKDDVLFTCSFPRYLKDTYHATQIAKNKGAKVITITDNELSDIGINSDLVLSTSIETPSFFNSYVVPMELCNILLMSILEKDKDKIYKKIKENSKNIKSVDLFL